MRIESLPKEVIFRIQSIKKFKIGDYGFGNYDTKSFRGFLEEIQMGEIKINMMHICRRG